jgi:predicted RNA-binding Zn ribbon-like protein
MRKRAAQPKPYVWRFVAGRLCLDFANTAGSRRLIPGSGIGTRIPEERLYDYRRFLDWAVTARVVEPDVMRKLARQAASKPGQAVRVWRRAVRLREALYRLGASAIEHVSPRRADIDVLIEELRAACPHLTIADRGKGLVQCWKDQGRCLDGLLWPIALSAVEFFVKELPPRLKRCPGIGCAWLFVDATKNGRRVWCSMSDCGNRSKVLRYRSRRRDRRAATRNATNKGNAGR